MKDETELQRSVKVFNMCHIGIKIEIMKTVYKVEHEGSYCVFFLLSDALDTIKCEVEDNYLENEDPLEYKLTICEMTEKEIGELPDFSGF